MFLFWILTLSQIYILKLWIFASWKTSFATSCKRDATATLTLLHLMHQRRFSHSSLCSLFFHFQSISKQWSCDNEQLSTLHHNTCRVFLKTSKEVFMHAAAHKRTLGIQVACNWYLHKWHYVSPGLFVRSRLIGGVKLPAKGGEG